MTIISQFIGFLFFLLITLSGFWCLSFLISIVPYWITMGAAETYGKINKDISPRDVRRKTLSEQEDVELLWIKS
ncbi:hypothetical protein [Bacteroidetes bacterium endosymbiont of Geopemphigus sp.]|uniref:hypothetical protein n=1 Tax=Bacteroidetes bacterium endosymbiont of Geopemphigus sp. TaxID=2047937 RepID=UPI000CD2CA5A|nr:hypothetical protein [Bacteroidetes bacterium endosymbiont of Geopemphigus sp.]